MKTKILIIGTFVITAMVVGLYPFLNDKSWADTLDPVNTVVNTVVTSLVPGEQPRIQLAILLDTSNSMDGLIDQTRNQLWEVVNEFASSKKDGKTPSLEVAVYEYGNNSLSPETGYIRQVTPLTQELDQVSEALFSLKTDGGNEYCGYVIKTAVEALTWSHSDNDIRTIFIAGNEPFTQGPVSFKDAITAAQEKDITINTIHAGGYEEGTASGWQRGALLAGGDYMNIDHNHQIAHINAPQDVQLAKLNDQLNQTYVPYGAQGGAKFERQSREDKKSKDISEGLMAKRAASKVSSLYNNSSWDLVDALENDAIELEELAPEQLPAPMQKMDAEERQQYVSDKTKERQKLKEEIKSLSLAREGYVAVQKAEEPEVSTIDKAMIQAVRKQGEEKSYQFSKKE